MRIAAWPFCINILSAQHPDNSEDCLSDLSETVPCLSRRVTGVLAFPLGMYESFFGSGNGLFTSLLLSKARGLPLLTALGYYYVIAFTWNKRR